MRDTTVPGSPSVREILALEPLDGARVLGGATGLDRRVRRLTVRNVPDGARSAGEHELVLVTGRPPEPKELIRLLTALDARGVAAVGVRYAAYGPRLTAEVLRAADDLGLPIVDIPERVGFDDLLARVAPDRPAALDREIDEALLRVFLDGGGLGGIVRGLGAALDGAGVICVGTYGQVLAQAAGEEHWERLRRAGLLDADGVLAASRLDGDADADGVVCAPVLAGGLRHGHLLAVAGAGGLPRGAGTMVRRSAAVAALEIIQRLAAGAVERRLESAAIHELLAGGDEDVGEAVARAGSFGWDLDRPLLVVVARRDPAPGESGYEHDIETWAATVRDLDRRAVAGALGRDLVAVCGADAPAETTGRALADAIHGVTRCRFSVGVSDVVAAPAELPAAYRHARTALDLARETGGPGAVMAYAGLGLVRLLNAVRDRAELRRFVQETLGTVLGLPEDEREDLLHTLTVLLDSCLNVAESARILHFHYNTLRYRIRKLERLVGPFTEDSRLRTRLSVALQILRMRDDHDGE